MWKVVNTTYPLRDQWICVRADVCLGEAGQVIAPYYTLEYPDFVHALAFDRNGHVILVRQYRHGLGESVLELPGGLMDAADSDPVATAIRELSEETGYAGGHPCLQMTASADPAKMRNRLHLVTLMGVEKCTLPRLDENEAIDVVLVKLPELLELMLAGEFKNAAHMGMVALGLMKMGLMVQAQPHAGKDE